MAITTSLQLQTYIYESLGEPQVTVGLTKCQILNAIEDAINTFSDISDEFCELTYFKHQITQTDLDNGEFDLSALDILDIYSVFAFKDSSISGSGFVDSPGAVDYSSTQILLNDDSGHNFIAGNSDHNIVPFGTDKSGLLNSYWDKVNIDQLTSAFFNNYDSTTAYFDYNKHTKILKITSRKNELLLGNYILVHGTHALNSDVYSNIFGNVLYRQLCVAMSKKVWAMTLARKYISAEILGGVVLNGDMLYQEAIQEIELIEEKIKGRYAGIMGQIF